MLPQNIIIREFELKDIPYLTSLTKELGYDTTADQMTERISNIMKLNNYWTLVAVAEDMVMGYIGLIKNYFWEQDGPYLRVQALVVNADYRKLGVGQKLIQAAEQLAKNHNIKTIVLNCTNREE
ncbi:MAG: GNAT family N-acetyltransferase, partial [Sediminibacterium sp.]